MPRDIARVANIEVLVPEPATTAGFLEETLDLHRVSHTDGREDLTAEGDYGGRPPARMLRLVPGERLAVGMVVFELARDGSLARLRQRVQDAGVDAAEEDGKLVLADPDGIRIVCSPYEPRLEGELPASGFRPRRLGHVNLKVTDASAAADFYTGILGLALSEQIGELLYFMRAGSDHHNLGVRGGSDEAGVHHVAFEIHGWESFRVVCDRVADLGHTIEYGPGRHSPGRNLFVYLRDPSSGLRLELFSDMAHIDDDEGYEPLRWELGDRSQTVNRWGPAPPESFLA